MALNWVLDDVNVDCIDGTLFVRCGNILLCWFCDDYKDDMSVKGLSEIY